MIHCVEVLAIYENPGTAPTGPRLTNRDNDYQLALDRVALVGKAVSPQANEYMDKFPEDGNQRYGTGWRCRQWIQTAADAATVGNAVWNRLSTRNLKDGTKVEVFPLDETAGTYTTGAAAFRRTLPAGSGGDIG